MATKTSSASSIARQMNPVTRALTYVWLFIVAVGIIFPVLYATLGAFHPTNELNRGLGSLLFSTWTFDNFKQAWDDSSIATQLGNSFIVTICQTLAQFVTSVLAAYAIVFGRFRRGAAVVFILSIAPMVFPGELNNLVNFLTVSKMGFYDTVIGIFLPYLTSATSLFLFYQSFRSFPKEIREAAIMEGVGPRKFLTNFLIPLNKPVCFTVLISSAIAAWNGYMWPLLITATVDVRTIQPGVRALAEENSSDTAMVLAGLLIASIPMLLLVTIGQRFLTRGLTAGAVK